MTMPNMSRVCITIQMRNQYESAETCFTISMIDAYALALLDELSKPGMNLIGKIILDQVNEIAFANAALMGYEFTIVASAEIMNN